MPKTPKTRFYFEVEETDPDRLARLWEVLSNTLALMGEDVWIYSDNDDATVWTATERAAVKLNKQGWQYSKPVRVPRLVKNA